MNAEDAIAVLAATDPAMGVPTLRPEDVLGIVEIPLRHGGYAEVYVAVAWEPSPDCPAPPFGVTVFQFEHAGAGWRWVTAMSERADDDRRDTPIDQASALEGICIGDTIDGHEIISLPSDPDLLFLLPRGGERARKLGRGLGVALRKLVRKPDAKLER